MMDSNTSNDVTEGILSVKLLTLNLCVKYKVLCALEGVICLQLFMFYSHFCSAASQSQVLLSAPSAQAAPQCPASQKLTARLKDGLEGTGNKGITLGFVPNWPQFAFRDLLVVHPF